MRVLKTFILLVFLSVIGYGQTKEETINWLKINGKDFLTARFKVGGTMFSEYVMVEDNVLKICSKSDGEIDCYNIRWDQILYQDVSTLPISIENNAAPETKRITLKLLSYEYNGEVTYNKGLAVYFNSGTEEDARRSLKAIMHLAKLNGAKENKQTF